MAFGQVDHPATLSVDAATSECFATSCESNLDTSLVIILVCVHVKCLISVFFFKDRYIFAS